MKGRLLAVAVAALAALLGSAPASASTAKFNPPKQYYLSLGDSLAFGYQQNLFFSELVSHTYNPADFPGYTYRFGALMQAIDPGLQVVDYGCPGETTVTYTVAGTCPTPNALLHNPYPGMSQEAAALAFLKAHHGAVGPITISLGVNDLFQACPTLDPSCETAAIPVMGANLSAILSGLRAAASPNTEIIVLQYYDPLYVVNGPPADELTFALNDELGAVAASVGARVADAFAVINSSGAPGGSEAANVCYFTLMCSDSDIHASDAGYAAIADVFWASSGYQKLTG